MMIPKAQELNISSSFHVALSFHALSLCMHFLFFILHSSLVRSLPFCIPLMFPSFCCNRRRRDASSMKLTDLLVGQSRECILDKCILFNWLPKSLGLALGVLAWLLTDHRTSYKQSIVKLYKTHLESWVFACT